MKTKLTARCWNCRVKEKMKMDDTVVYETGGSDDKLPIEPLPGERREDTFVQSTPRVAGGFVAQEGTGSCGGVRAAFGPW